VVEVFNFIKVIFIALFLIIIFALLSPVVSDSIDVWKGTIGNSAPFLTFIISGMNFWIFLGLVIGILAGIVYGVQVWGNAKK
jgi:hypothetical protein